MKLSEAIRMNGMMVPQGFGEASMASAVQPCALGGALQSIGKQHAYQGSNLNYWEVEIAWPWSVKHIHESCPADSNCHSQYSDTLSNVYHLNDSHHWTREQIAAWVASIEPQENQADSGQGPVENSVEVELSRK
jgi:hypothetical protein